MSKDFLVVNTPQVVAEVIDGELVAIQLETGCYYHSNTVGSFIWRNLEQGMPQKKIIDRLKQHYVVTELLARTSVEAFVKKLLVEKLLRKDANKTQSDVQEIPFPESAKFEKPTLQKHEDMKELLLLDPIHDIGDASWPLKEVR